MCVQPESHNPSLLSVFSPDYISVDTRYNYKRQFDRPGRCLVLETVSSPDGHSGLCLPGTTGGIWWDNKLIMDIEHYLYKHSWYSWWNKKKYT